MSVNSLARVLCKAFQPAYVGGRSLVAIASKSLVDRTSKLAGSFFTRTLPPASSSSNREHSQLENRVSKKSDYFDDDYYIGLHDDKCKYDMSLCPTALAFDGVLASDGVVLSE